MKIKHNFRVLAGSAFAILLSLFLNSNVLFAQSTAEEEMSWPHKLTAGVGGGASFNTARGGYTIDDNIYNKGNGIGPEFHALLEIPIGDHFMFAPRVNYTDLGLAYTDGVPTTAGATALPNFAVNVRNLGVEILGKFTMHRVHVLLGPSVSALLNNTWAHGNHDDANNSPNELPGGVGVFAAAQVGVGYDAPLNSKNTLWLTPEVMYAYPLTDLGVDPNDLSIQSLRTSLSLKFDISGEEPAPPPPPARPLSVTITAKGLTADGQITNEPVLPVKQTTTRASVPILPSVFFDDNSSVIPARYSQSGSTGFSEMQLEGKDALDVNHSLLDIVGSRMKQNPEITVTVTGTNSNTGSERNNTALSRERASALRDYLVGTWGISADRIHVDARNLPELPTNPATPAGIEENRRAEIAGARVTDPVIVTGQNSTFDGETLIRYEISVVNPDNIPVSTWRLTLDNNGTQVGGAESGSGTPPTTINSKIPDAGRFDGKQLHYTMEVTDANGRITTGDGMTRVVRSAKDEQFLEKYAMLSFDFDSAKLTDPSEKMVSLIGESINRDALGVKINGFCDMTGTDEYNQALSERRAQAASNVLSQAARMPSSLNVAAHGENDPKFTNDLPEGRQLNRRVEVEIQKSK